VNSSALKVLKAVGGALAILILVITVARWYGDYRISATDKVIEEATSSVQGEGSEASDQEPTAEENEPAASGSDSGSEEPEQAKPTSKTVVVLTDGLNFRKEPKKGAAVIRGLDKGEKLTLIEEADGWYYVETSDGTKGYISASSSYSEIQ